MIKYLSSFVLGWFMVWTSMCLCFIYICMSFLNLWLRSKSNFFIMNFYMEWCMKSQLNISLITLFMSYNQAWSWNSKSQIQLDFFMCLFIRVKGKILYKQKIQFKINLNRQSLILRPDSIINHNLLIISIKLCDNQHFR